MDSSAGLPDREAAQQLGITLTGNFLAEVNEVQLRRTFAEMSEQKLDAAIVDEGGTFLAQRALIVELAQKHRIPVIYPYRDYADSGGLMAYTPEQTCQEETYAPQQNRGGFGLLSQACNSSSSALASFKSRVSKPSVNQP